MEHIDARVLERTLDEMPLVQRREWFIKIRMNQARTTFSAIAARHRLSTYALAGAVSGTFPWGRRVVNALENEFDVELTCFLDAKERAKAGRVL